MRQYSGVFGWFQRRPMDVEKPQKLVSEDELREVWRRIQAKGRFIYGKDFDELPQEIKEAAANRLMDNFDKKLQEFTDTE